MKSFGATLRNQHRASEVDQIRRCGSSEMRDGVGNRGHGQAESSFRSQGYGLTRECRSWTMTGTYVV